jgi:hypothetical protein
LRPNVLALGLSAGVPCVLYLFTASAFAYWLDSGEFVAAAVQLDIAHPPGHPLSALWGKAFSLLPLGSLSFRVAFGQVMASALASLLQCRAIASALRGLSLDPALEWSLACFGALLTACTYALWFQAVRPEVYALQTLCVAAICERLAAYAHDPAQHRSAYVSACGIWGLSLTNHHLIALLLAPAFLPGLFTLLARRSLRSLGAAVALGAWGLTVYLYLPLRAAEEPPANFGDPSNFERFGWVVSAQVYAHDMGSEAAQPLATRLLDVVVLWFDDWPAPVLLLAALGLYLGLRLQPLRRASAMFGLVGIVDAVARAWLGSVRGNPDMLGYLAPSFFALGSLAACGLGACVWSLESALPQIGRWAARAAWLAPVSALWLIPGAQARSSLAGFTATDEFDELRIRRLPPRAAVMLGSPQSVFRELELRAVEGARPDLVHVPLPFLRYPGESERWRTRPPELARVVRDYLGAHDHLQGASLADLARTRPVFVELDARVQPALLSQLRPRGVLTQLSAAEPSPTRGGLAAELAGLDQRLRAALGDQVHETETGRQLLWLHYLNAVHLGALGLRDLARAELERARTAHPEEQRLQSLADALQLPSPFDPEPFLTF